jgi:hypothetical protein
MRKPISNPTQYLKRYTQLWEAIVFPKLLEEKETRE